MLPRFMFLSALEDFLVKKLLESRSFHKAVRATHRTLEDIRHGEFKISSERNSPPSEVRSFMKDYVAVLKEQLHDLRGKK